MNDALRRLVHKTAAEFGIEPLLLEAMVLKESGGIPARTRYEPHFAYLLEVGIHAKRTGVSVDTERIEQMISWGPLQVMGGTARELGFQGLLPELCDPATGLHYGAMYLKKKLEKYPDIEEAVGAYNSGSPRREGTFLANQPYVDWVMRKMRELQR
jgi:soluble lytic murein transglycosylase-like protein